MKICSNCKFESTHEELNCSQCGTALNSNLTNNSRVENSETETLLMTVNDEYRAKMIEEFLGNEGIPALIKYEGSGEYLKIYMGYTHLGINIFVNSKDYIKATEMLAGLDLDSETEFEDYEDGKSEVQNDAGKEKSYNKKRHFLVWLLLLLFLSSIVVSSFSYLMIFLSGE